MSDTTTTELERLRGEMEVLKRHAEGHGSMQSAINGLRARIDFLETEQADPWREAKKVLAEFKLFADDVGQFWPVKEYIDHLTAENERLAARVAELESNAVWGIHSQVDGHLIKAFNTRAEAEAELEKEPPKFRFREVKVSCAKSIVKALNETQKAENRYRVERDAAWRRVKELEAEIATADEITSDYSNFSQAAKEAYEKAHKPLADMQPPFEGPIVGLEPILDPARVLATACELLHQLGGHWQAADARAVWRYSDLSFSAKPYRLKGAENGG